MQVDVNTDPENTNPQDYIAWLRDRGAAAELIHVEGSFCIVKHNDQTLPNNAFCLANWRQSECLCFEDRTGEAPEKMIAFYRLLEM